MEGIQETKEVLVGLLKITAMLAEVLKDGITISDASFVFAKIQGDLQLRNALVAAYQNIEKVPSEIKDLSTLEAVELAMAAMHEVPNLVLALQKAV